MASFATERMRAALVAISDWKLSTLSSSVSANWTSMMLPDTRNTGAVGKDDIAFAHAVDRAAKAQLLEVLQVLRIEAERRQVFDILGRKVQVVQHLERIGQPGKHGVAAVVGRFAEEVVEGGVHVALATEEIRLPHRDLVQVGVGTGDLDIHVCYPARLGY